MKTKLKPIPDNTVVHTPTEEEAKELLAILHENGWKWGDGDDLGNLSGDWQSKSYLLTPTPTVFMTGHRTGALDFAEFKERYCKEEKPQPKFKVGERVYCPYFGYSLVISEVVINDNDEPHYYSENDGRYRESILEPYTEHETKPIENMETKDYPPYLDRPKTVVETPKKELNLCELLQGHEGETFFSPISCTDIELKRLHMSFLSFWLDKEAGCTIECGSKGNQNIGTIDDLGRFQTVTYPYGSCMIYPSRALYEQYPLDPHTAWMKWQEEQTIFHIRIEFQPYEERGEMKCGKMGPLHFNDLKLRTPADRDKCISEIKAIIEKYSEK